MNAPVFNADVLCALIREGCTVTVSAAGAIKIIPPSSTPSSGAERVRRHRERKRAESNDGNDADDVTHVTHEIGRAHV